MGWCIVCKGNGAQAQTQFGNQTENEGNFSGLFSVPSNEKRKKLWCEALKISKMTQRPRVCFRHFPKSKIDTTGRRLILKKGILQNVKVIFQNIEC